MITGSYTILDDQTILHTNLDRYKIELPKSKLKGVQTFDTITANENIDKEIPSLSLQSRNSNNYFKSESTFENVESSTKLLSSKFGL